MSKEEKSSWTRVRGTLVAFNLSPRGRMEGALVETAAGPAQINFPRHTAEAIARSMSVGSKIDTEVEFLSDDAGHPIYLASGEQGEARGRIVSLNYALHGEVNGYRLDDGTLVHVKPEGAKKHKLHVGDTICARGALSRGTAAPVLDARSVERWTAAPPPLQS